MLKSSQTGVIAAEIRDLLCGDVPYFYRQAESTAVFASDGKQVTSLDTSLEVWSQEKWLDPCMQCGESELTAILSHNVDDGVEINDQCIMDFAFATANQVVRLLTDTFVEDLTLTSPWISLYDGLLGSLLLLAALYNVTKEKTFLDVCSRYAKVLVAKLETKNVQRLSISAFNGVGSIVYCLALFAVLLDQPELLDEAVALAEKGFDTNIEDDDVFDLIDGCAGAIVCLCNLFEVIVKKRNDKFQLAEQRIQHLIRRMVDHILQNRVEDESGVRWPRKQDATGLTGLSHGNAGISLALRTASKSLQTANEPLDQYVLDADKFENKHYNSATKNWSDIRRWTEATDVFSWCYGGPGISMARSQCTPVADSRVDATLARIDAEFLGTAQHTMQDLCLCCGRTGIISAKAYTASVLTDTQSRCKNAFLGVLRDIHKEDLVYTGTLAFFSGLSGIAYTGLQLLKPSSIPHVNMLQLEVRHRKAAISL